MKNLNVNILGGKDVGKTTVAMHAVAELRWLGISTALVYDATALCGYEAPIVGMRIYYKDLWTPHSLAELCRDTLTFLVRRPKDYEFTSIESSWRMTEVDAKLETMMIEGRVRYKSLPGVRASVLYIVKKVCEGVGYDR